MKICTISVGLLRNLYGENRASLRQIYIYIYISPYTTIAGIIQYIYHIIYISYMGLYIYISLRRHDKILKSYRCVFLEVLVIFLEAVCQNFEKIQMRNFSHHMLNIIDENENKTIFELRLAYEIFRIGLSMGFRLFVASTQQGGWYLA